MADDVKQKILIAVDGSEQAEGAFDCKYCLEIFMMRTAKCGSEIFSLRIQPVTNSDVCHSSICNEIYCFIYNGYKYGGI